MSVPVCAFTFTIVHTSFEIKFGRVIFLTFEVIHRQSSANVNNSLCFEDI